MVQAVAEKGYARVAVADVIERAGVSRKTFYEQFANKDECFLAAYDAGVDRLLGGDRRGARRAGARLAGGAARRAVEVYLETLAASPAFARAFLIEVLGAGPAALERRSIVQEPLRRLSSPRSTAAPAPTSPRSPSSRPTPSAPRSGRSTSSSPRTCSSTAPTRSPSSPTRSSTSTSRCSSAAS